MSRTIRFALAALIAIFVSGCLIPVPVPGPWHHHPYWHGR